MKDGWASHGTPGFPHKMTHPTEGMFIKVTSFPVPDPCVVEGESMWVKLVEGDENKGTGILSNEPAFCEVAKNGDLIEFSGGTDDQKPSFVKVVSAVDTKQN
jgi:hypothetical protein